MMMQLIDRWNKEWSLFVYAVRTRIYYVLRAFHLIPNEAFHRWSEQMFSCVCPVIDDKFRQNIVKVDVDPRSDNQWICRLLWQYYEEIKRQQQERRMKN